MADSKATSGAEDVCGELPGAGGGKLKGWALVRKGHRESLKGPITLPDAAAASAAAPEQATSAGTRWTLVKQASKASQAMGRSLRVASHFSTECASAAGASEDGAAESRPLGLPRQLSGTPSTGSGGGGKRLDVRADPFLVPPGAPMARIDSEVPGRRSQAGTAGALLETGFDARIDAMLGGLRSIRAECSEMPRRLALAHALLLLLTVLFLGVLYATPAELADAHYRNFHPPPPAVDAPSDGAGTWWETVTELVPWHRAEEEPEPEPEEAETLQRWRPTESERCSLPPPMPWEVQILLGFGSALVLVKVFKIVPVAEWCDEAGKGKWVVFWMLTVFKVINFPLSLGLMLREFQRSRPFGSHWQAYQCFGAMLVTGPWLFNWCIILTQAWGLKMLRDAMLVESDYANNREERWNRGKARLVEYKLGSLVLLLCMYSVFLLAVLPFLLTHVLPGALLFAPITGVVLGLGVAISRLAGIEQLLVSIANSSSTLQRPSMQGGERMRANLEQTEKKREVLQQQQQEVDAMAPDASKPLESMMNFVPWMLAKAPDRKEIELVETRHQSIRKRISSVEKAFDAVKQTNDNALLIFAPIILALRMVFEASFFTATNAYTSREVFGILGCLQVAWVERGLAVYFHNIRAQVLGKAWMLTQFLGDLF